jgi:azurin
MKFFNLLAAISLILFIGCGGSGDQQAESSAESQQTEMAADDVRTIEMIGIDQMKFVVDSNQDGITVSEMDNSDMMRLETITASPGEQIRIRLTTKSTLPASAMAHNWVLLTMEADVQAFASAAMQARDNDYIPADMTDQIIAQTGLAAGGETTEVTFTAPEEPGEYEYICTFTGHFSAGMKGILTVEDSGSETSATEENNM